MLTELDRLVQLLESPIFTPLRMEVWVLIFLCLHNILKELDRLVQLLESPIFTPLRMEVCLLLSFILFVCLFVL